eukprot:gene10346-12707_t
MIINGFNKKNNVLIDAFSKIGCSQIFAIDFGLNYCAIGFKGQTIGTALESINSVVASVSISSNSPFQPVVKLDNISEFYTLSNGMNVITFPDKWNLHNCIVKTFDTSDTNNSTAKLEFSKYIDGLGGNTLFLIITKGNAKLNLGAEALVSIERLGSNFIYQYVNYPANNKWFMLTKKKNLNPICELTSPSNIIGEFNKIVGANRDINSRSTTQAYRTSEYLGEGDILVSVVSANLKQYPENINFIYVNDIMVSNIHSKWGILMVTISEVNGLVFNKKFYDLGYQSDIHRMAMDIFDISIGTIVVICMYEFNPLNFKGLSNELVMAFSTLGSQLMKKLNAMSSYAFIGRKGSPPGSCAEKLSNDSPVSISQVFNPRQRLVKPFIEISTVSLGDIEGYSQFYINSIPFNEEKYWMDGVNMVSINPENGIVENFLNYNVFTNISDQNAFIERLKLVKPGTIISLSFVGSPKNGIPLDIRVAIKNYLGSMKISEFISLKSYCIIAVAGNNIPPNQRVISECISPSNTLTRCNLRFPVTSLFYNQQVGFSICCTSKGSGGNPDSPGDCEIMVNGKLLQQKDNGLNVFFIDPTQDFSDGIQEEHFDTVADEKQWLVFLNQLATFKNGTIVVVAIKHSIGIITRQDFINIKNISLSSIGACKFFSVPQYGSYSIIGIKGMPPGSANEYFSDGNSQVCVSSWEPKPKSKSVSQKNIIDDEEESPEPPFGMDMSEAITSVPVLNYLNQLNSPSPLIINATPAPNGNIFQSEPAWSTPNPVSSERIVKALLIGVSYASNPNGFVKDVKRSLLDHAQVLLLAGYVEKQNLKIICEGMTQTSNNGRSYKITSPSQQPKYGLGTLTDDLSTIEYSFTSQSLQTLFSEVPKGVNITVLLDCSYAFEIFSPLSSKANGILSVSSGDKVLPIQTQQTIGFLPAITQVLSNYYKKNFNRPTQTYGEIFELVQLIKEYKSKPALKKNEPQASSDESSEESD